MIAGIGRREHESRRAETERGRSLRAVILALKAWGDANAALFRPKAAA
jgi:DNA-binding HxlR family transcriptional regulator